MIRGEVDQYTLLLRACARNGHDAFTDCPDEGKEEEVMTRERKDGKKEREEGGG